jgi:hypothetical protein
MATDEIVDKELLSLMGLCLLCIQQAEQVLAGAVESVLDRPRKGYIEESAQTKKKTLGEMINRAKRGTKLEHQIKEDLFTFLNMRNKFVHDVAEIPGWSVRETEGREIAKAFLVDLMLRSIKITITFITVFNLSAKNEFGVDLFSDHSTEHKKLISILEEEFRNDAQSILDGRRNKPAGRRVDS